MVEVTWTHFGIAFGLVAIFATGGGFFGFLAGSGLFGRQIKHPDGFTEQYETQMNKTIEDMKGKQMYLEKYAGGIIQRAIITKRELYGEGYLDWREFVDVYEIHGQTFRDVSMMQRSILIQQYALYNSVRSILSNRPQPISSTDGRIMVLTHSKTRALVSMWTIELESIAKGWSDLHVAYKLVRSKNTHLHEWAERSTLENRQILASTKEGWSNSQKVVRYVLPLILTGGLTLSTGGVAPVASAIGTITGPIVSVFIGPVLTAIGALSGPIGVAVWHIMDTFKWKDDKGTIAEKNIENFGKSATNLADIDGFLAYNVAASDNAAKQARALNDQSKVLDSDHMKDEFLDIYLHSIEKDQKEIVGIARAHGIKKLDQTEINQEVLIG